MKKTKISKFIDIIFILFISFFISLIWVRYFVHNSVFTVIFCVIISLFIMFIYIAVQNKKEKKLHQVSADETQMKNCSKYFLLNSKKEVVDIFFSVLKDKIVLTKTTTYLKSEKSVIYPQYSAYKITDSDVLDIYKKTKRINLEQLIILGVEYTKEAKEVAKLIKDRKIILFDEKDIFINILKPAKYEIQNETDIKKLSFKEKGLKLYQVAFTRAKSKPYLISAIILLIGSFFMRYNIYYIIVSSILLLLSAICRFAKFEKEKSTQSLWYETKK